MGAVWLVALLASSPPSGDAVVQTARDYLGYPYVYGDEGSYGFDCSGFVRAVYASHGFTLPRRARDQSRVGEPVAFDSLVAGDLVFFTRSPSSNRIGHVGIATGDGHMIHASSGRGEVLIDPLTQRYWRLHRAEARRILGSPFTEFGTAETRDPSLREHDTELPASLGSSARPALWHRGPVDLQRRESSFGVRSALVVSDDADTLWLFAPQLQLRWNHWDTELGLQVPLAWSVDGERVLLFDSAEDALRLFDRARIGSPDADVYLEASRDLSLNLGRNSIVDGLTPSASNASLIGVPRRASFGVGGARRAETVSVFGAIDDVIAPAMIGARVESVGRLRFGGEVAVDPNAPGESRFAGGITSALDLIDTTRFGLGLHGSASAFDSDTPAPLLRAGLSFRWTPSPLEFDFSAEWRGYQDGAAPDLFGIDYRAQRDAGIWARLDEDSESGRWQNGTQVQGMVSLTRRFALRAGVTLATRRGDAIGQDHLELALIAREWRVSRGFTLSGALAYHQRFVDGFLVPGNDEPNELIFANARLQHRSGFSLGTQLAKRPVASESRLDAGIDFGYGLAF